MEWVLCPRSYSSQVAQTLHIPPPHGLQGHGISELPLEGVTRPFLYSVFTSLKDWRRGNSTNSGVQILGFHHLWFVDVMVQGWPTAFHFILSLRQVSWTSKSFFSSPLTRDHHHATSLATARLKWDVFIMIKQYTNTDCCSFMLSHWISMLSHLHSSATHLAFQKHSVEHRTVVSSFHKCSNRSPAHKALTQLVCHMALILCSLLHPLSLSPQNRNTLRQLSLWRGQPLNMFKCRVRDPVQGWHLLPPFSPTQEVWALKRKSL